MTLLSERKLKNIRPADFNADSFENVMKDVDDKFRTLDNRRLTQIDVLSDSATSSDIITKINDLINALNASDLTNED